MPRATTSGPAAGPGFVLVDDAIAREFAPFSLTRPVGELRAGGALIRHRWAQALGMPCVGFIGAAHLESFAEFDAPPAVRGTLAAGTVMVNARCAPVLRAIGGGVPSSWICDGRVAAVRLREALDVASLERDAASGVFAQLPSLASGAARVDGWWLDAPWDLVRHLNAMLEADALAMMPATGRQVPEAVTVLGAHAVHVEAGAHVEPLVVADASAGPILVRRGASIQAFTRLVGPCIIGEDVTVSGGRIASCSIGERCKVNGEMNSVILIGHANKGHDGFVGHTIVGRWANFGAGTITSNLKNSYGTVTLKLEGGDRDTGLQFLGSLVGDHVKTGIGTRLTTGCIIGAGANVFGSAMPPKRVPAFAWGEPGAAGWEHFALERFLVVAQRVMARRNIDLTDAQREQLTAAHRLATQRST